MPWVGRVSITGTCHLSFPVQEPTLTSVNPPDTKGTNLRVTGLTECDYALL